MNDKVFHPSHYQKEGRMECWDEQQELFGKAFVVDFCVGSAYKYLYRAGEKENNPKEQDIAKIKVYMNKAKSLLNEMGKTFDSVDAWVNYKKMCGLLEKEGIDIERTDNTDD